MFSEMIMNLVWLYTLISVGLISLVSLIGLFTIPLSLGTLKKVLLYMVSFSAGALLGDVFIHLLPEIIGDAEFGLPVSLSLLCGIVFFFIVEKIIHWRHCHIIGEKTHAHPIAYMNLYGETVHNFIDGLIIGASYLVSTGAGIATTIAVILHEIPSEIGDFAVLLHGGFSRNKALLFNFITALSAVAGGAVALVLGNYIQHMTLFLIPFASGGFIYIACVDLIPELHKEIVLSKSILQILSFMVGVFVMILLL